MGYVGWAMVAMAGYGATTIFLKLAFRSVPSDIALVVTNTLLILSALGLVLYRGDSFASLGQNKATLYLALAGLALSVSIISYYFALSRGPVSVVAPIFAMNFAVAGVLGILFLGESVTLVRAAGLVLAAGAIVLLTR
jgi:transporter family protein